MKSVTELDCQGKVVFYRPDYNVPLKNGVIQDDFRIIATFPTIDTLIEKGAKIVIGSHMGRPDGKVVEDLELTPVAQRIADQYDDVTIRLAHSVDDPDVKAAISEMEEGDILILPNLRFYAGEEENDKKFAGSLASLADYYVNDAFACDHRAHASIVGVPELLPAYAGFLVQAEVEHLGGILEDPTPPFVVVMGGAKVSDKIGVIEKLGRVADRILIGGAMANTFLLAMGEEIGASVAEPEKVEEAKSLMEKFGSKLIIAEDYLQDKEGEGFKYLDIGEKAVTTFIEELKKAKTVFWNGSLGYTEDELFAGGSKAIAEFLAGSKAKTIIAGGDTVELISRLNIRRKFNFVSTGGGAALEFLAGDELPGIAVLDKEVKFKAAEEKEVATDEAKDSEQEVAADQKEENLDK